ncbi:MAG: hypothetical protein FJY39_05830 [Betaproteobacteria bacterium]|nr:hypothetical protein [Betaproteobacteria bacterium]
MTSHARKARIQIPSPELSGYQLDEEGAVWHKGGHRNGRDKRLTSISFTKAMQCVGERVGLALVPTQVVPGIWKMRFAGALEGMPYLGGRSLADFFRQHAFGPDRVQPEWWPTWSRQATEVAASINDEQAQIWTVISHLKHDRESRPALERFVETVGMHSILDQSSPVIVLGPLARIEIFSARST